ncbi:nucleotidyltransferase domain-containing protein [Candidatus Shapirobacteria bacterium]|nr:nucleotidyltransferase domain-containing protein [Candidatus Shapirobacteria bacterium]
MSELDEAVKKTIEYGEQFGVSYTADEVKERLISRKVFNIKKLSVNSYELRVKHKKNNIYLDKIKKAKKLAEEIGKTFPSILFIGVTGSVAAGYPDKNSDIDLMLITKKDSLWITRLMLRIWVWAKGIPHRRYGATENKNEFCFNLWLEEDVLGLPKNKQNLRNAMDTILMKPMLNKNNIYESFLKENRWVKKWVANGYKNLIFNPNHPLTPSLTKEGEKTFLDNLFSWLLSQLNHLVFWPQWWYMKKKIGGGLVDIKRAFFHPSNGGV